MKIYVEDHWIFQQLDDRYRYNGDEWQETCNAEGHTGRDGSADYTSPGWLYKPAGAYWFSSRKVQR